MISIIKKMFEGKPEKSTIELKERCSDCGSEVIVNITSTAEGFGLEGGALFKRNEESYFAKCLDCYK